MDRRTLRQKISLRKILRFLFSRMVIVGVLIFLQLAFLVALLVTLEGHLVYAYPVLLVLSVGVSVWVVTGEANPAYKLSWVAADLGCAGIRRAILSDVRQPAYPGRSESPHPAVL